MTGVATPRGAKRAPGSACRVCREKKRKCDAIKPACGPCEKRHEECVYGPTVKRSRAINSLEASSSFSNKRSAEHARKYPRSSPLSATTVEPVAHKGRNTEGKNGPIPRIVVGKVITCTRATTSSASGHGSNNGELQNLDSESAPPASQPKLDAFFPSQTQTTRGSEKQDTSNPPAQICQAKDDEMPNRDRESGPRSMPFMAGLKRTILRRIEESKPGFSPESQRELERRQNASNTKTGSGSIVPDADDSALPAEFFTALTGLYKVYEDVVAIHREFRLVGDRNPQNVVESFNGQAFLKAERLLSKWKTSLSTYQQQDGANRTSSEVSVAQRQRNLLLIRHLYMSLLLYRPCLALIASSPEIGRRRSLNTPLAYAIIQECAIKCVLTARELVTLITSAEPEPCEPFSLWRENVGYTFACANVFIAARLFSQRTNRHLIDADAVHQGWRQSIRLLERFRPLNFQAGKCISALEHITETLLGAGEPEGDGHSGEKPQLFCDMTWIECLPVDLADQSVDSSEGFAAVSHGMEKDQAAIN